MIAELQRDSAAVRVLVVSANIATIELLCEHTRQTGMHVEISCNTESATSKLCRSKFEGLIVDFELSEGARLLRKMRELTSHKNAISLAIANHESDMPGAMRTDANFVLNHPLSSSSVARVLRASYPLMFRERQRYYRYPIEVRTLIRVGTGPEFPGQSINISESGVAIHSPSPLKTSVPISLRLDLPGLVGSLEFSGEVQWSDELGRTGIRFTDTPTELSERLRFWISAQMNRMVPDSPLWSATGPGFKN
ncbi:MAG TPA: PilZ domain-containing protein [Terriglobales bacterium]